MMPRAYAEALARLIDRDAPAPTLSPAVTQALARRDEDGAVVRVTRRLIGRWCPCPGGNEYEVSE